MKIVCFFDWKPNYDYGLFSAMWERILSATFNSNKLLNRMFKKRMNLYFFSASCCYGFNPQTDRAAIRRTDYPAMGGNQLVTESQAHKWIQAGLDRHRL